MSWLSNKREWNTYVCSTLFRFQLWRNFRFPHNKLVTEIEWTNQKTKKFNDTWLSHTCSGACKVLIIKIHQSRWNNGNMIPNWCWIFKVQYDIYLPVHKADTVVDVRTVMIKVFHTPITYPTMLCTQRSYQSTCVAEVFQRILSCSGLPFFIEWNLKRTKHITNDKAVRISVCVQI